MIASLVDKGLRALGVESGRVSPRERAMITGLAAAGAIVAAVSAFDWSEGLRIEAMQARAEREELERSAVRQAPGLTDQMLAREVEKVRRMSFAATSIPIARAAAQAQIERMANQAGIEELRVSPVDDPEGQGALRTQSYSLQGRFDWPSFLALIEAISGAPQSIGVLGVQVDAGPSPSFALKVRVPLVSDKVG